MAKTNITDVCSGSYEDGTACDNCRRCFLERKAIAAAKAEQQAKPKPKPLPKIKAQPVPNSVEVSHVEPVDTVEFHDADKALFDWVHASLTKLVNDSIAETSNPERRRTDVTATALTVIKACNGGMPK